MTIIIDLDDLIGLISPTGSECGNDFSHHFIPIVFDLYVEEVTNACHRIFCVDFLGISELWLKSFASYICTLTSVKSSTLEKRVHYF